MSEKHTLSNDIIINNNNKYEPETTSSINSYSSFIGLKRNQIVFDDYDDEDDGDRQGRRCNNSESESDSDSGSPPSSASDNRRKDHQVKGLDVIREEECESSVFSLDIRAWKDVVHVCVGKYGDDKSSLEALSWTLKHWITPFTTLCLLHVFPLVRLIPSPLGKLPRSHVNKAHINRYLDKHKCSRNLLLQKFNDLCLASRVKVETMLIEGDDIANSIIDVIKNKGILKLTVGITKSNLSRKSGSRRSKGIADEVAKKAPETCDVKVICEGKDVIFDIIGAASASPTSTECSSTPTSGSSQEENRSSSFTPSRNFFGPRIPFSSRIQI